jgi:hypothetical protein
MCLYREFKIADYLPITYFNKNRRKKEKNQHDETVTYSLICWHFSSRIDHSSFFFLVGAASMVDPGWYQLHDVV